MLGGFRKIFIAPEVVRVLSCSSFDLHISVGNNWAHGYFLNGPPCMEAFDVLLKSEFEKCDLVDGLVTTMSLAGGTGSGVGTYLLTYVQPFKNS